MKLTKWMGGFVAALIALSIFAIPAGAQGRGRGHDKGNDAQGGKSHRKEEKHDYRYTQRDRDQVRSWYREHQSNLPPGLAKRDRLPPGLERQLRVRGTLPPGLRDKIVTAPPEFVQQLPPPPPDCEHVFIGGNLVLMNRRTFLVLDIFRLLR